MPETAMGVPVVVEAKGLSHRYGRKVGLDPVDFRIESPGVVAVTGPNGSGKSTLMRALAGLLRPSGGSVSAERAGESWPAEKRRLAAGFCSPDVALYDEMTVFENIQFASRCRGLESPESSCHAAMKLMKLDERAHDRVGSLSSGWRQRARLAFALLGDPNLILLDEPGSHLDEEGRASLEGIVNTFGASRLVVIATNDEREWTLGGNRIDLAGGVGRPR